MYVVRLSDPDPWWHLATGRWIVEHHAVPRVDPFSFTVAGASWRAVDALADSLMYGSWVVGGDGGVGAWTALCAFAMLLLLGLTLRGLALSTATVVSVVACVGVMVQGRYSMGRPMTLGAAFLCATIYACTRSWRRQDRAVWAAPAIVVAWTFAHSTVVLGIAVLATFALAAAVVRHAAWRRFVAAALVTVAACALLPSGRGRFAVAFGVEHSSLAMALTREWARTTLATRELWLPLALTGIAVLVVVRARDLRREALPYLGCVVLGALVASRFQRNLCEAILLAAPLGAIAVERGRQWLLARKLRAAPLVVVLVVGALVPAIHVRLAPDAFNPRFGVGPDDGAVPVETLAALRALPDGRVMNDCTVGGWLIWQRIPVYCDGRTVALYREDDVERLFVPLYGNAATLDAVADGYDIHYALARFDSDFQNTLMRAPSWQPVALDREHALFVRRRFAASLPPERAPLGELRFVNDAAWLDPYYAAVAADPARTARLRADVVREARRCPTSRTLRASLQYLQRAQPALAAELERALTDALR